MRYIRYAFWAVLAVVLVTVALANRDIVTLRLAPDEIAGLVGLEHSIDLPLFLVILGGIVAGLAIGYAAEWMREHKHRAAAAKNKAEVKRLERELRLAKGGSEKEQDEVLALLDKAS